MLSDVTVLDARVCAGKKHGGLIHSHETPRSCLNKMLSPNRFELVMVILPS